MELAEADAAVSGAAAFRVLRRAGEVGEGADAAVLRVLRGAAAAGADAGTGVGTAAAGFLRFRAALLFFLMRPMVV